jgi:glycine C-acetyltransferase
MEEPEHHAKLWANTDKFRKEMESLGFDLGMSTTPIIPVMCGESAVAKRLAAEMSELGVVVGAIVFPMVARDGARVRNQLSAGLTDENLDEILIAYEKAGKSIKLI